MPRRFDKGAGPFFEWYGRREGLWHMVVYRRGALEARRGGVRDGCWRHLMFANSGFSFVHRIEGSAVGVGWGIRWFLVVSPRDLVRSRRCGGNLGGR